MESEAVLCLCIYSVVLLHLAFESDRSLARLTFQLLYFTAVLLVDPFVLNSLIELATGKLDDVSAFVLRRSLDEDRWVKPSQFLKRIAQLTK